MIDNWVYYVDGKGLNILSKVFFIFSVRLMDLESFLNLTINFEFVPFEP